MVDGVSSDRSLPNSTYFFAFTHSSRMPVVTAYYVAFGPHGPRTPANPPGTAVKVGATVTGLVAVAAAIITTLHYYGMYSLCVDGFASTRTIIFVAAPPPKTLTKEWQEASNEYARENKINPITGMSSMYTFLLGTIHDPCYPQVFLPKATRAKVSS